MRKYIAASTLALALSLSACGGSEDATTGATDGEKIENVAAPEGQQWADMVTKTDSGGYMMGNPDAPIKFVEYGSMTCGACAAFSTQAFETLRDEYVPTGRVSFEFRNFVRDPIDVTASVLAQCGGESSFFALTEQMFTNQPEILNTAQTNNAALQQASELPENQRLIGFAEAAGLLEFAASRGISRDQATSCLSNIDNANAIVAQTQKGAEDYDISGTPTFLINGKKVDNLNWDGIQQRFKELGAR